MDRMAVTAQIAAIIHTGNAEMKSVAQIVENIVDQIEDIVNDENDIMNDMANCVPGGGCC